MSWEKFFSGAIRIVFLSAYGAFLWASIHHVAWYYHGFEPDTTDWTGSYWLAASIDVTQLVLTIGIMFFHQNMGKGVFVVGFFIVFLTAFSWLANWEFAAYFQSASLTHNSILIMLNPILASSFAFLNLAYSIVSRFFAMRVKTVKELKEELDGLDERLNLENQIKAKKNAGKKGLIERAKETALEVKNAVNEIRENEPLAESKEEGISQDSNPKIEVLPEPEIEALPETPIEIIEPEPMPQSPFPEDILKLLNLYPDVQSWLSTGQKTATIEEIIKVTNHTKKKITNRLNDGTLKRTPRNQNLILISSVIDWLKVAPLPSQNGHDTAPLLEVVKLNGTHL